MEMARFLVTAVVMEKRSVREVARSHGVSKTWLYELIARYKAEGEAGLVPRSRRPRSSPTELATEFENEVVALRKELAEAGFDAGPETIREHLVRRHGPSVPSRSTIWRILKARGFVTPEPHKRPRSSYVRFVADLPNERWQMDVTHFELATVEEVEILNVIDDHSRLCVASVTAGVFTSQKVLEVFQKASGTWGYPEKVLTDNGGIFTAAYRGGVAVLEASLLTLGIAFVHSRPYHPQTCGKVERFHQTMKKYLARRQPELMTKRQLQGELDRFVAYYNEVRPHRAIRRQTPRQAYGARVKATPSRPPIDIEGYRVRQDVIDKTGSVTLRYLGRLRHLGVGRGHKGTRVLMLVAGADVRVLDLDGRLLRAFTLDPTKDYQGQR